MSERILIVLPNWFGETLFMTPALRALREASPQARLSVLGVPTCQEVLANHPVPQEFITYDERGLHRSWSAKRSLVDYIRTKQFDTAIILRRSVSRTLLLKCAGIPRRIGFANWKSGWLLTDRIALPTAGIHKADTYAPLLASWGVSGRLGPYEYYPSESERAWASMWLGEHELLGAQRLVVLHPGANWEHKRWMVERFAELGNRLVTRKSCAVLMTGGPDDEPIVNEITRRLQVPVTRVVGQTTFRQLAALLERAHLCVAADTGVLHVASALGRPIVALYGPTSPALTGPLGDAAWTTVIHHRACCPRIPCYRPRHPTHPGMTSVSIDEVYEASCHLLDGRH